MSFLPLLCSKSWDNNQPRKWYYSYLMILTILGKVLVILFFSSSLFPSLLLLHQSTLYAPSSSMVSGCLSFSTSPFTQTLKRNGMQASLVRFLLGKGWLLSVFGEKNHIFFLYYNYTPLKWDGRWLGAGHSCSYPYIGLSKGWFPLSQFSPRVCCFPLYNFYLEEAGLIPLILSWHRLA